MDASPVAAAKHELREWARRARADISGERRLRAEESIAAKLLDSGPYRRARTVAAYLAFGGEADLTSFIGHTFDQEPDKRLVLPRIQPGPERRLALHLAKSAGYEPHPWGLRQPPSTAPLVEPSEVDLVLVPGLAFDRRGGRLGYGAGYYDRLLALIPTTAPRVGVTFDALVVDRVPIGVHDVTMSHLASESGLREVAR